MVHPSQEAFGAGATPESPAADRKPLNIRRHHSPPGRPGALRTRSPSAAVAAAEQALPGTALRFRPNNLTQVPRAPTGACAHWARLRDALVIGGQQPMAATRWRMRRTCPLPGRCPFLQPVQRWQAFHQVESTDYAVFCDKLNA